MAQWKSMVTERSRRVHIECWTKMDKTLWNTYIYLKYFSIAVLDLHAYLMGPWMLTPHPLLRKRDNRIGE